MKHTALWFASLVFAFVLTWVVFPRVAFANSGGSASSSSVRCGELAFVPSDHEANMGNGSELQSPPDDEEQGTEYAQLEMSNGAACDGDDLVEDGFAFVPHVAIMLRPGCGGSVNPLAPLLRSSQSFVGLHDKVPR